MYTDNAATFAAAKSRLLVEPGQLCPEWKNIVPAGSPWWGGWWGKPLVIDRYPFNRQIIQSEFSLT